MKRSSMIVALGSLVYSGAVVAESLSAAAGPSWEVIGVGAIGLLITAVGWYAKGVSDRVSTLESKLGELNTAILRDYHPKSDVKNLLDEIKQSIAALHARFEKMENLYGR
jgi:hypothetical protein